MIFKKKKFIYYFVEIIFQATKEFIEAVNKCRAGRRAGPVSWGTAVKFLAARKFEVARALALYDQHEATRRREGLARLNPTQEPLQSELRTGKFTVLVRNRFTFHKKKSHFFSQLPTHFIYTRITLCLKWPTDR